MTEISALRAGVVGTGFIGVVHVDALRRLGVEVAGVVGSTPERASAKGVAPVYESYDALLADAAVDVVHLTTPNDLHYPQVKQALAAGKHVVCEKPLAMTSVQSSELVELAEASGLVHCTNFNIRFYPIVQEARERVRTGEVGTVWDVHGGYLQDWLATPEDWNWRLEPARGGEMRAVGDIGSHWMDLTQFVTGQRVVELFADLATVIPVRRRPVGEVETFGSAADVERVDAPMSTEDLAHVLLRFDGGARGSFVISQVSFGRKNSVHFEVDGSAGALAWHGERHEELWIGRRDAPNEILLRNAAADAQCGGRAHAPAGRARRGIRRHVPGALPSGVRRRRRRRSRRPSLTTRRSATAMWRTSSETPWHSPAASEDGWRCRREARTPDRSVPEDEPRAGREVGVGQRLRDDRGRVLAGSGRRAPPLRGRQPHRRRPSRRGGSARHPLPVRTRDLLAGLLPEQPAPGPGGAQGRQHPPQEGDHGRGEAGRADRGHLRRA